jgi:hypothetical protein
MMKRRIGCLPIVLLLLVTPYAAWKALEYRFQLGLLPPELNVWWISAAVTEHWGFGPGGNETGVIVYSLPSAVAEQIADKGLQYFSSPGRQAFGWLATPIETGNLSWSETKRLEGSSGSPAKRLEDFLNRYGFGIEIPSWISRLANQAIVSPGNFFSYGPGGGVIIVIPAERKVVLAYAG